MEDKVVWFVEFDCWVDVCEPGMFNCSKNTNNFEIDEYNLFNLLLSYPIDTIDRSIVDLIQISFF